jgi:predicted membrane-bound mannosyltransferase
LNTEAVVTDDRGRAAVPSLLWGLIAAGALAIRLTALDRFSYWLDEMLQVFTIRLGWGAMWRTLREQVLNPPLDYIAQKAFDVVGPTDAARRILPAVWGTGFVVVCGLLISRRANRRVGMMTAVCLAFAPAHVRYSQEVRPYSLGLFLTAVTLLLIDRYLERPSRLRLAGFLLGAVAVAYTMFLAGLVLLLAGGALILDDALSGPPSRRQSARQLLRWSPGLILIVAMAYMPWLPLAWRSMGAAPISTPPVFAGERVWRWFSYFGFGFHDWYPLGWPGAFFIALAVGGAVLTLAKYRLRFLFVWAVLGLAITEALEERHGVYDSIFHFLPAGIALTVLASLPIGWLAERRPRVWLALVALAVALFLDTRALTFYFQRGRVDWRPVAGFLRRQPTDEPIFTAGQYTQLCLAYYVNGPDWLCCDRGRARSIIDVGYDAAGLSSAWNRRGAAWLVTPVGATLTPAPLREAPGTLFPTADEGVLVRRLAPERQHPE